MSRAPREQLLLRVFIMQIGRKTIFCVILVVVFFAASKARADTAIAIEESGLKIKLDTDASDSWYTLSINSISNKPVSPEVFALENPPRLVVDVPGFAVKASRQAPVQSGKISALRIGVHPDKLRLVFDLRSAVLPSFSSGGESNEQSAMVTLNFGAGARQPVVPTQETPPDLKPPQETPEVVGDPRIVMPPKSSVASSISSIEIEPVELPPTHSETLSPEEVAALNQTEDLEIVAPASSLSSSVASNSTPSTVSSEEASVASSSAVITGHSTVRGIFFKSTPEYGPSLVVNVDTLGRYSLSKKQENLFELVLENTQFAGPFLELPQFSPDTFDGLDVLVAEKRGGDVALKIYVGEGIRLAPFRIKGELWIRIVK